MKCIHSFFLLFIGTNVWTASAMEKNNVNKLTNAEQKELNEKLILAVMDKKPETVSQLIKNGAKVDYLSNVENGLTPLMIAAKNTCKDTMLTLLDNGADPHYATYDFTGYGESIWSHRRSQTPLFIAAQATYADGIELLIAHKANPFEKNLTYDGCRQAESALSISIKKNADPCIKIILDYAKKLDADISNNTISLKTYTEYLPKTKNTELLRQDLTFLFCLFKYKKALLSQLPKPLFLLIVTQSIKKHLLLIESLKLGFSTDTKTTTLQLLQQYKNNLPDEQLFEQAPLFNHEDNQSCTIY